MDESKNQTAESINDHWVELSKAYKALTDEEVRNNFIQYGHPDGKQSFSIGIALPKFIITNGNGKYVLLLYGLLLGVLLPYIVGKWWYGSQRMTREKVLFVSAGNLFKEYKEDITDGGVISALSCAEEFKDVLKGNRVDSGLGKIEKNITEQDERGHSAADLTQKDLDRLEGLEGVRRKALALLWAYLGRLRLDGSTLDDGKSVVAVAVSPRIDLSSEKYEAAPLALALNESFIAIALAFGSVPPLLSAYRVSQHLIQATPPHSSPLLQLPHMTPSIVRAIEGPKPKKHLTIQQFMDMPEYERRKLATDLPNVLTPSQYSNAVAVARQLPLLKVEKAFFKVLGEKFITTGSLVQLVVKVRVIPPGSANVPEVNETDLEDVDPDEGDLDALLGRKSQSRKAKLLDGNTPPSTSSEKPLQPPLAFAPYFARDHSPRWHVFLADGKLGKIAVPPFTFTTFNKPVLDDAGRPTFNMQTFKMQFQAPPQAGKYPFVMHLMCDSYIGMDNKMDVMLNVEDSEKAMEMNDEDEISEPDEGTYSRFFEIEFDADKTMADSLAGQMNALKTGGLAGAPPRRSKKRAANDSSDDESDTEGEAGDTSETDTDTDTDGE